MFHESVTTSLGHLSRGVQHEKLGYRETETYLSIARDTNIFTAP